MVSPGTELIRRMAGGDREALAAFYDLYAPLAFGLLRRMLRDVDEAAEVLQEVFWELWRAAGEYDPRRGSPEAWVTVWARSRGIDRVRSVRRREEMFVAPTRETARAARRAGGRARPRRARGRGREPLRGPSRRRLHRVRARHRRVPGSPRARRPRPACGTRCSSASARPQPAARTWARRSAGRRAWRSPRASARW